MRGRIPKPTAQKRAEGNPGKRPLNEDEPRAPAADVSKGAPHLTEGGQACWADIAPLFQRAGLLSVLDKTLFEQVCEDLALVRQLRQEVAADGAVYQTGEGRNGNQRKVDPRIATIQQLVTNIRRILTEFGGTPAARTRVRDARQADMFAAPEDDASAGAGPDEWLSQLDKPSAVPLQ